MTIEYIDNSDFFCQECGERFEDCECRPEPEYREEHPSSASFESYDQWKYRRDQARREERDYE